MSKGIRFSGEFKRDTAARSVDPGYTVSEVAERLGINTKSPHSQKVYFTKSTRVESAAAEQAAEIRRLSTELTRVTEEHTI